MKVKTINSIEVSSLCNMSCQYCPAQAQGNHREVGLMSMDTFKKAMRMVEKCVANRTQMELNLFGVGEPLLNPDLCDFVRLARQTLPFSQPIHLNTNGKLVTREIAAKLKAAGVTHIDITAHEAYSAANAIRIFRSLNIEGQISIDAITQPNDWAGQVEWFKSELSYQCPWLHRGQVMIMSNGDITTCCIDAFGRGIVGTVDDNLEDLDLKPFELCQSCHQTIPQNMQPIIHGGRDAVSIIGQPARTG